MKRMNVKVVVCLLIGSMAATSCIGSYKLFNKFTQWELRMTNNKFVNAIIGFIIDIVCIPVTLLVDSLVLNTVEFWSGENPLASNEGKTQQVLGSDGRYYAVTTLKDGYEIKAPTGEITYLIHNAKDDSWSMKQNGVVKELFRFNADGGIQANINGEIRNFTPDAAGVYEARMAANDGVFFAQR